MLWLITTLVPIWILSIFNSIFCHTVWDCLSCLGVICLYSVSLGFVFGVPLATFQSALGLFVLFWDFFGLFSISMEFHLAPFQSFQLTTVVCWFICLHFTQSGLHLVWFEVHLVPFNQCGVHSAAADSAEWLQHTAVVIYRCNVCSIWPSRWTPCLLALAVDSRVQGVYTYIRNTHNAQFYSVTM